MSDLINLKANAWLHFFVNFELQNSVFIVLLFILLFALNKYDAALKKQLVVIGLIKTLIPPIIAVPYISYGIKEISGFSLIIPSFTEPILSSPTQMTPSLSWQGILFLLWLSGMALILIISVFSIFKLYLTVHNAREINPKDLALPEKTKIYVGRKIKSPLVFGWLKPKIILPFNWDTLEEGIQQTILLHEINHIRDKDLYLNGLKILSLMIHFLNPLNWILIHYLELFTELACDDRTIIESGIGRNEYGSLILQSAEAMSLPVYLSAEKDFSKAFRLLKQRLLYQLNRKEDSKMKSSRKLNRVLAMVLSLVLIVFSIKCSQTATKEKENPATVSTTQQEQSTITQNGVYEFFNVDTKPKILVKARPEYPEKARKAGIEGTVVLTVTIDKDGKVSEAVPLKALPKRDSNGKIIGTTELKRIPELEQAAIAAAKKCTFTPAEKDGQAVNVKMNIPFKFRLH